MLFKKIKSSLKQKYLRYIFDKTNNIGKSVFFDADASLEGEVSIGDNSIIGARVNLGKNVKIGKNVALFNTTVGENSVIEAGVICTGYGKGKISIGKESYIGIRNILDWSDNITIGDYVHVAGPGTGLWTHGTHKMCLEGIPLSKKDDKDTRPTAPIKIENNVYIGGNCTIYPGVSIRHHSVVAPNSAVARNVEPYTMVGGVPARFIKKVEADSC